MARIGTPATWPEHVVALGGGRLKETLTAKDLFRLPSELTEDGCYELLEGKLYKMPPPGPRHGEVTLNIGVTLRSFVRVRELGRVMVGDPGFILRRDPDTVRGPDVAYVSYERHPANEDLPSRYIELAPDLAVEVVSPSQTRTYVDEKAAAWLAAGVLTVWVVDPRTNQVAVHRTGQAPTVLNSDDTLDGSPALPGFACRVAEFFR